MLPGVVVCKINNRFLKKFKLYKEYYCTGF